MCGARLQAWALRDLPLSLTIVVTLAVFSYSIFVWQPPQPEYQLPAKWRLNDPDRPMYDNEHAADLDLSWMSVENTEPVTVVMWEYERHWAGFGSMPVTEWAGYPITREVCPIGCHFVGDQAAASYADGIIFEAQPHGSRNQAYPDYKPLNQKWIFFSYETAEYFPVSKDYEEYLQYMDWKMYFEADSDIVVTMHCLWGYTPEDYIAPRQPQLDKTKFAVFVASNCNAGGADRRTEYVRQLMEHVRVDSLGKCLQNVKDEEIKTNTAVDKFQRKINKFREYTFVLAFENSNVTDYVTEKITHALLSGAIPVYMGAPNIEEWLPGDNCIINVNDYDSPADLAEHLKRVAQDPRLMEKYYEWKKKPLRQSFLDKFDKCVLQAECRTCMRLAAARDGFLVDTNNEPTDVVVKTYPEAPLYMLVGGLMMAAGGAYVWTTRVGGGGGRSGSGQSGRRKKPKRVRNV